MQIQVCIQPTTNQNNYERLQMKALKMSCGTTLRELKLKNKPVKAFTLSVPHVALNLVYT